MIGLVFPGVILLDVIGKNKVDPFCRTFCDAECGENYANSSAAGADDKYAN